MQGRRGGREIYISPRKEEENGQRIFSSRRCREMQESDAEQERQKEESLFIFLPSMRKWPGKGAAAGAMQKGGGEGGKRENCLLLFREKKRKGDCYTDDTPSVIATVRREEGGGSLPLLLRRKDVLSGRPRGGAEIIATLPSLKGD